MNKYLFSILIIMCSFSTMLAQTGDSKRQKPNRTTTNRSNNQISTNRKKNTNIKDVKVLPTIVKELANNMIFIEGGTFTMGGTSDQGPNINNNERPTHQVKLSNYYICKYEVTQDLWQTIMGYNPSNFKGAKLPVENVSWNDCILFIKKLNNLTRKQYRLPTEAEWEYASRGGKMSNRFLYSGSNYINDVAWNNNNSDKMTHDVGTKKPNELGLYDMSGNVWEWCQDFYSEYLVIEQINPVGPSNGSQHVHRGGAWNVVADHCRPGFRFHGDPNAHGEDLGFRLVISK